MYKMEKFEALDVAKFMTNLLIGKRLLLELKDFG
jgi:hypothetical protein